MTGAPPLTVTWLDGGREPMSRPNSKYPLGVDIDGSGGATQTCRTALPYPAPRCGSHLVRCSLCKRSVAITAAGRLDDPRSVRIPCNVENRDAAGAA